MRVVFKIPDAALPKLFGPVEPPSGHLAYVEWFSRPRNKDKTTALFPVSRSYKQNGQRDASIVEVDKIVRPCHLFPKFDKKVNRAWTPENVLDRCDKLFLNPFVDKQMYQSIF